MKGSFNFTLSSFLPEFRDSLLRLAQGKRSFPITIDENVLFLARVEKLILETKLTSDTMEIEYGILNHSITEPPLYKWLKENYPDVLMEYTLMGTEDLDKEEK